jgi:hypothetical protein
MSLKATFLIIAACIVLHVPSLPAGFIVLGYLGFARFDDWFASRARDRVFEYHISGWRPEPDEPRSEAKGSMVRVRLGDNEQIIVMRIAEIVRALR